MIRTQVSLSARQMSRLREAAQRTGLSMAAIVRQAVDVALDTDPDDRGRRWERAAVVAGAYQARGSGPSVARHHDEALAQIYSDDEGAGSTP